MKFFFINRKYNLNARRYFSSLSSIQLNSALNLNTNRGNINFLGNGLISIQSSITNLTIGDNWINSAGRTLTLKAIGKEANLAFGIRFSSNSLNGQLNLISTQSTVELIGVNSFNLLSASNKFEAGRSVIFSAKNKIDFSTSGQNQNFDLISKS